MAPPPSSSLPLPYSEDVKPLIDQHLLALSKSHPSLLQKTATFTHNDGRSVTLLQSDGTVPMVFQNVTYNIPVLIWLTETYPRNPPLVFVNPTRDMVIRRSHPFVNQSGLVWIPYLEDWVFPSSNLVDLARDLSSYFGIDPPLYSLPRPNPNPNFMEAWFSAQAVVRRRGEEEVSRGMQEEKEGLECSLFMVSYYFFVFVSFMFLGFFIL
ncbi:hypothetical protein SSX86_014853 [Deinandra increscens subsp. villosa]|uniref:UEV domain-containing protein n=1 Tax=Deinandra increscens subsp. villosa TaxID=3103831 RepID=A0AAP0D677_9ASTR